MSRRGRVHVRACVRARARTSVRACVRVGGGYRESNPGLAIWKSACCRYTIPPELAHSTKLMKAKHTAAPVHLLWLCEAGRLWL